jgi:hypothetical protein
MQNTAARSKPLGLRAMKVFGQANTFHITSGYFFNGWKQPQDQQPHYKGLIFRGLPPKKGQRGPHWVNMLFWHLVVV